MSSDPLPSAYGDTLLLIKDHVRAARRVAQRRVSTQLVLLYWEIGATILERQRTDGWGAGVVDRLARDLRAAFPDMTGLSRRNLLYVRAFAAAWPDLAEVQQVVALLPWGHVTVLLDRLRSRADRDWYAQQAAAHGWSRDVLVLPIKSNALERFGAAPSNSTQTLEGSDSELAQQLTKDPYVLDFLELGVDSTERDVERGLVDRIIDTLRELGTGFAFVGRQVHLEVGGEDFFVDLLFFHTVQLRFVVVELKSGAFRPEHLGQLSFSVTVVDDRFRLPQHAPTVGLLLVADKSDPVVKYALRGQSSAVGVAQYELLPDELRDALPSAADLSGVLSSGAG